MPPSLAQVIQPCLLVFAPDDLVKTAINAMSHTRTSCVLVKKGEKLVGILTERDVVRATAADLPVQSLAISELMTWPVKTCSMAEATDVFTVYQLFQQHHLRHLPILDNGHLVGLVTLENLQAALKLEHLLNFKQVGEVMTPSVVHALPTTTLLQLAHLMAEQLVSCVVLVEAYADVIGPVGIVTERDILQFQALGLNLKQTTAATAMSTLLPTVKVHDTLWTAQQKMQQLRVSRLVVTGKQGELQGIITKTDMLRMVNPADLHEVIATLQQTLHQKNATLEQEIKERQQAEIAIQTSEARFRTIFEQAAVGITQATLSGRFLQVNQQFCRLLGYTETELLHQTIGDITHPADRSMTQDYIDAMITGQAASVSFEKRYICKNGQQRWVQITASLVTDALHQQQYLLNVIQDIQERKQAEADLNAQQVFLRKIIDAVGSAIFVKDATGRFLTANQATADIYGVSVEALLGKSDLDFNPNLAQVEEFWAINREVMATQQKQVSPSQLIQNSRGENRWYRTTISPFVNAEGQDGVIGVAADITDLKNVEEALRYAKDAAEAANLAKSQFLANMSHELRTPLNSILGFAQLLSQDSGLSQDQQQYLEIILRSGEHLLELINDVLEMAKIDAGRIAFDVQSFDLSQLLNNLQEMLQLKASAKELELIFDCASNVPRYIQTDESKLRQVLLNLLSNAIKFTTTGRVTLRVRLESAVQLPCDAVNVSELSGGSANPLQMLLNAPDALLLYFAVEDTGPGIASSELNRLFEPFVQGEAGRQSQEGTGLGLAISRRFVELMGGKIYVKSTKGQGATFEFKLPTRPAQPEKSLAANSFVGIAFQPSLHRILVVEDQSNNRTLVVRLLSKLGFEVQEAVNGEEAVQQWQQWSPRLILMDMRLPKLDGYTATRMIRERERERQQTGHETKPPTVIIALTASAFTADRSNILAAGCDDYIPKPFKSEKLLEAIARHLNLTWVCADATPTVFQPQFAKLYSEPTGLTKQTLAALPLAWKVELHKAAAQLDAERCRELIEAIALQPQFGQLMKQLMNLVHEFRFDVLLDLSRE